jgi:hypothetical protein
MSSGMMRVPRSARCPDPNSRDETLMQKCKHSVAGCSAAGLNNCCMRRPRRKPRHAANECYAHLRTLTSDFKCHSPPWLLERTTQRSRPPHRSAIFAVMLRCRIPWAPDANVVPYAAHQRVGTSPVCLWATLSIDFQELHSDVGAGYYTVPDTPISPRAVLLGGRNPCCHALMMHEAHPPSIASDRSRA